MRLVTSGSALLCTLAALSGCGGSSDSSSSSTAASTKPSSQTTPTETAATDTATTDTATTETETAAAGGKASPDSMVRPDTNDDGSPDEATFRGKVGDSFILVGQPGYKKPSKEAAKV